MIYIVGQLPLYAYFFLFLIERDAVLTVTVHHRLLHPGIKPYDIM